MSYIGADSSFFELEFTQLMLEFTQIIILKHLILFPFCKKMYDKPKFYWKSPNKICIKLYSILEYYATKKNILGVYL